jgi:hypothetical protein
VQPEWIPYNEGLKDATMIMDLAVAANGKLRLGTHGKGLWEADMPGAAPSNLIVGDDPASLRVIKGNPIVNAYPNPTYGAFRLTVNNVAKEGQATIKVIDISGRQVQQFTAYLRRGDNIISADLGRERAGNYQVVIETGSYRAVQKIMKQ